MISGSTSWDSALVADMSEREIAGKKLFTFNTLPTSVYQLLKDTAERTPDAVAIVDEWHHKTTFAELKNYAEAIARYLAGKGVVKGSHVGVLMHSDMEFAAALFGISAAGCVFVPLPSKYREPELSSLCEAAHLSALLVSEDYEDMALRLLVNSSLVLVARDCEHGFGFKELESEKLSEVALPELKWEDPVILMYTSGTTSTAKGVVLRNYNVVHAALVYARLMSTTPKDRCLIPIPIYHVTGLIALLIQFVYVGATTYLHRLFNAHRVLQTMRDDEITYLHGTPTFFAELLALRNEFPEMPHMRVMLSGSSYEPVAVMRDFYAWMPDASFQVVYGMTETSSPALLMPENCAISPKAGATGKPVPGLDAKIVDENDSEVATGEVGELKLRGTCICQGYLDNVAPGPDADGWFATGDLAKADADGYVWVVDRKKDMINRGGEKVWCSALEEVLCELDGVRMACVAGIPDDLYGEVPVAALVCEQGYVLTESEVRGALKNRIASFKVPTHVIFINSIPQTRGDKPDRRAVRSLVLDSIQTSSH